MTRRPVAETREAVAEWLAGQDTGQFLLRAARDGVNKLLNGGAYDRYDFSTDNQVSRILDEIAARGELIKVSCGDPGPGGHRYGLRQPAFYTPAGWEAAVAEADRDARQAEAIAARWAEIYDELVIRGYPPATGRGHPVRLSFAAWSGLLGLDGD